MKFLLEFLANFSAQEILRMYAGGAFRTADEIKVAEFTVNFKIVFDDEHIPPEELKIYKHLQKVIDAIRLHEHCRLSSTTSSEEVFRYFSTDRVEFTYFVKYGENEREVERLNIVERRIVFAFKPRDKDITTIEWLKGALSELLGYVLREFDEADRVGIVIKHESNQDRKAAFPIKLKTHLEASIIRDTLNSIISTKGSFIAEERMTLQVLRIRIPAQYRKFTQEDLFRLTDNELFTF